MSDAKDDGLGLEPSRAALRLFDNVRMESAAVLRRRITSIANESDRDDRGVGTILGWLLEDFRVIRVHYRWLEREIPTEFERALLDFCNWLDDVQRRLWEDVMVLMLDGQLEGWPLDGQLDLLDEQSIDRHKDRFSRSVKFRTLCSLAGSEYVRRFQAIAGRVESAAQEIIASAATIGAGPLPSNPR